MRIWLFEPFEPVPSDGFPVMRYRQLAREFGGRGHDVTWWSSDFFHFLKTRRPAEHVPTPTEPYRIRALHPPAYRSNRSATRVASHIAMATEGAWRIRSEPVPDLIVTGWGPVELAAAAVSFAKRHGVPVCVDVLDPWPDSFETVMLARVKRLAPALLWPHRKLARWTLRRATAITAVSEGFLAWALGVRNLPTPVKSAVFLPRASAKPVPERRELHRPLRLLFAGTIGHMYDFDLMLGAAELLEAERPGETVFEFAGSGPLLEELRARALPGNVRFHGHLLEEDLDALATQCDVGLCCFPPFAPTTLTTKLFFYLSHGLPVLGTPQREMARFLADEGAGRTVGTAREMASVVSGLLEGPGDWNALAAGAFRHAQEHSIDSEMAGMADFAVSI